MNPILILLNAHADEVEEISKPLLSIITDLFGQLGSWCCGSFGLIVFVSSAVAILYYFKKKKGRDRK